MAETQVPKMLLKDGEYKINRWAVTQLIGLQVLEQGCFVRKWAGLIRFWCFFLKKKKERMICSFYIVIGHPKLEASQNTILIA